MKDQWQRRFVRSGSPLEETYGYCRAVRVGPIIHVGGTAPIWPDGVVDPDPGAQARRCLEIIASALENVASSTADVVRTRVFVTDGRIADDVGRAHLDVFGTNPPVMSMVIVAGLLDTRWLVEIEADAVSADGNVDDSTTVARG